MSKEKYFLTNGTNDDKFFAVIWETNLGNMITVKGKLDIQDNLKIYDAQSNAIVSDIDLREILLSILP